MLVLALLLLLSFQMLTSFPYALRVFVRARCGDNVVLLLGDGPDLTQGVDHVGVAFFWGDYGDRVVPRQHGSDCRSTDPCVRPALRGSVD